MSSAAQTYPRITVVTPNYNQGDYIEQTIQSVLGQDYPNLEYIIIDGASTDASVEIIKSYEQQLSYWVSEPDNGMYDAINKGFERSTGDIMCWINSDDVLWEGALDYLASVMGKDKGVHWLQGYPTVIDSSSRVLYQRDPVASSGAMYAMNFKEDGAFIQQESTFWTRTLWEQANAKLNTSYQLAADFDLWMQFFHHQSLYCSRKTLGAFRKRPGQKSADQKAYMAEAVQSVRYHKRKLPLIKRLKLYFIATTEPIHWID